MSLFIIYIYKYIYIIINMKIFNTNKFSETSRILIVTKFILVLLELILTC